MKYLSYVRLQQLTHIDFELGILVMTALVGISNLFIYCYFGKIATDSFRSMSDCLYQCDWPDLPTTWQKHYIILIGNAQIPLNYNGLGLAILNLETFVQVKLKTTSET